MPGWRPGGPGAVWSARWTMPPGTSCPGRSSSPPRMPEATSESSGRWSAPAGSRWPSIWTGMGSSSAMTPPGPWPRSSGGLRRPRKSGGRWRRWGSRPILRPEPASQGADRAPLGHPPGPARRRAPPGGDHHAGRGQCLPPRVHRALQRPLRAAGGRPRGRLAARPPGPGSRAHLQLLHGGHGARNLDNTVRTQGLVLQIPPGPGGRGYAKARVEVRQLLDGTWRIYHHDRLLATQAALAGPPVRSLRRRHYDGPSRPRGDMFTEPLG